jgi:hypothetical protein
MSNDPRFWTQELLKEANVIDDAMKIFDQAVASQSNQIV